MPKQREIPLYADSVRSDDFTVFLQASDWVTSAKLGYTVHTMSVIDEVIEANQDYARTHELRKLTPRPERKLAVLTCMDTRLSVITLGLQPADAHIIRNAGGIVTDDSLRSLLISHYLLGTEEFMVINHTDCGLMHTTEQDMRTRIQNRAGTAAIAPALFYAFQNIEENVRHQVQKLRNHPWIPQTIAIRGFVYDVSSGLLREIK
ncbi:MAG: carbonic anhydrase [Candidatus Acidiferrum sp.]